MEFKCKEQSPPLQIRSPEEENLHGFCKSMLKLRTFKGFYKGRRYVESLSQYRDLIELDPNEKELKDDLNVIKNKINNFYLNDNLWPGISMTNQADTPNICIWTNFKDLAFGPYTFLITSVQFKRNEFVMKIKPTERMENDFQQRNDVNIREAMHTLLENGRQLIHDGIKHLSANLTWMNTITTLRFLSMLLLSIISFTVEAVKQIGNFSLRFMQEFRLLLHTCTPIIIKLIDLFTKVIGAIFMIIVMLYKDIMFFLCGRNQDQPARQRIAYYKD